jgi:nickel transport protein
MLRRVSLAIAAAGALTNAAHAHGIWTAQRHGDLAVVYGHGAGDDAYEPGEGEERRLTLGVWRDKGQ